MTSILSTLRSDVGAQRQLLTLFLVSGCLLIFESILFFRVIIPEVRHNIQALSQENRHSLPAVLAAALRVLHEREQTHVAYINRVALGNNLLLIVVAFGCAAFVIGMNPLVRDGPKRPVVVDVCFTLTLLVLFQIVFCFPGLAAARVLGSHFFGKRWEYTSNVEHLANIAHIYDTKTRTPSLLWNQGQTKAKDVKVLWQNLTGARE